ncbi:Aste57867_10 [Aphanomyces stellatus]|uniref:Aste57867_10 protein n=1 Tax=Aphanomyces stellatus TaxID=120398 RepID=A0A485K2R0_9STRA|nr:hypothetical protein As57867_000010 [Aphanomyces stellatus]VFT77236.1 Aste57867_10 [Aphanomyces stellatus]
MTHPMASWGGGVLVLGVAAWIYVDSKFPFVMCLRFAALAFAVAGVCVLPSSRSRAAKTVDEQSTGLPEPIAQEPEYESEDTPPTLDDIDDAAPEFVCPSPLQRKTSRDVYVTTQEETWAQDAHGNMFRSQSLKNVLIRCPPSENMTVLQRMMRGGAFQSGVAASSLLPAPPLPASPASSVASIASIYLAKLGPLVRWVVDYVVKYVGTAFCFAAFAFLWNYARGVNLDTPFHTLFWKHLQSVDLD